MTIVTWHVYDLLFIFKFFGFHSFSKLIIGQNYFYWLNFSSAPPHIRKNKNLGRKKGSCRVAAGAHLPTWNRLSHTTKDIRIPTKATKMAVVQAVVGSIVWAFCRLKKPRSREMSARSYAFHSVCPQLAFFLSIYISFLCHGVPTADCGIMKDRNVIDDLSKQIVGAFSP